MRNRKKNLIEALHGSFMFLDNLPELIDKETIYDETGHVDLEFMTAILQWMSRMADISVKVQTSLNRLLGCEELADRKAKKADNGSKWNVEEILRHCTLEDNVLKLPSVQFNKKSYLEAKKWTEEAGGHGPAGKCKDLLSRLTRLVYSQSFMRVSDVISNRTINSLRPQKMSPTGWS